MKSNLILNNGVKPINNPQGTVNSLEKDVNNPNFLFWLGGFVEGEGSISVSVVVNKAAPFGVLLQPIFNVTQHINGISILEAFKVLFNRGNLHAKSGSPFVWVYELKGYKSLLTLAIPFYLTYVLSFGCKIPEFEMVHEVCLMMDRGEHKTKEGLAKMVTLAYSVQGKGKYRKRRLEEVLSIIQDKDAYFAKLASSDTTSGEE